MKQYTVTLTIGARDANHALELVSWALHHAHVPDGYSVTRAAPTEIIPTIAASSAESSSTK